MKSNKAILVGIDYSLASINALKEAIRMATARNLWVICFHVLDEKILKDFHKNVTFDAAEAFVAAHDKLSDFIRDNVNLKYEIDSFVKIGDPFEEIIEMISDHHPETLVLGSHGLKHPYFEQVGTLASRCVRKAPVEVLLIRDAQDKPFHSIGACVDFSENSIRAAHRAAEIALQDDARLQLIHIYRPASNKDSRIGWLGLRFPKTDAAKVKKEQEMELEKLRDELVAKYGLQKVSYLVSEATNVAKGLFDVAMAARLSMGNRVF